MQLTGDQTQLLMRLLDATALRQRVIASNVANQNTPGYTRQVVRFEELLRDEAARGGGQIDTVAPQIVDDLVTPRRPDGNNVSMELEVGAMRENRLLYETYSAILEGQLDLLNTSITEVR